MFATRLKKKNSKVHIERYYDTSFFTQCGYKVTRERWETVFRNATGNYPLITCKRCPKYLYFRLLPTPLDK